MSGPSSKLQRHLLVGTTAVAVVTDASLIPFYPRLFEESFGVEDPRHVGVYLAATCLIVMLVLPAWAWLERRWSTLQLLCIGQLGAGTLALLSFAATKLLWFWLASLLMIVFKASYLLVYPYVMRLEDKSRHADTIALLTVIVHVGGIAGATIGGWVLERHDPRHAFLVMAAGDFLQMVVCLALVRAGARTPSDEASETDASPTAPTSVSLDARLARLGALMAVFYFAAFIIRPFFVEYWGTRSVHDGELIWGLIYSIPAWASLLALAAQRAGWTRTRSLELLLAIAIAGVALQCLASTWAIVVGRFVFGWAAFRAMVQLDLVLFEISPPSRYARDFSRMNLCQQGGVLIAFSAAGATVAFGGLVLPFWVAIVGFACVAAMQLRFAEVQP